MPRCQITIIILLAFAVTGAQATSPPAYDGYGAGWGMNPTNWQSYTGSWSSGFCLYDPGSGLGGGGWIIGWNPITHIVYAPITLELWIEMNMVLTYQYTSYQWHRLGNVAETITFTIDGTMSSNNSQVVLMSPVQGWDLNYLKFMGNVFGQGGFPPGGPSGNENARDIPITWQVRWGNGLVIGEAILQGWTEPYWLCGNMLLSMSAIPACDHWFQYQGTFNLLYHEADGYYSLVIAGCPYPQT